MDYDKGFVGLYSHEILVVDDDDSRLSSAILISVLGSGYVYGTLHVLEKRYEYFRRRYSSVLSLVSPSPSPARWLSKIPPHDIAKSVSTMHSETMATISLQRLPYTMTKFHRDISTVIRRSAHRRKQSIRIVKFCNRGQWEGGLILDVLSAYFMVFQVERINCTSHFVIIFQIFG